MPGIMANSPTLTHRAWGTRKTSSKVKYRDGIMPPRRSRAMRETRATRRSTTFNDRLQPVTMGSLSDIYVSPPPPCTAMPVYYPHAISEPVNLTYSYADSSGHNNGNVQSITNNFGAKVRARRLSLTILLTGFPRPILRQRMQPARPTAGARTIATTRGEICCLLLQ